MFCPQGHAEIVITDCEALDILHVLVTHVSEFVLTGVPRLLLDILVILQPHICRAFVSEPQNDKTP